MTLKKNLNNFFYFGIVPAIFFQTIGAYFYFILFSGTTFSSFVYSLTKILIIAWPIFWFVFGFSHNNFLNSKKYFRSILYGLFSGLSISLLIYLAYYFNQSFFLEYASEIKKKVIEFNLLNYYFVFAVFLSLVHSLIEEYFWRWFIFGGLSLKIKSLKAAIIGSIGFGLHHLIILFQFFPFHISFIFTLAVVFGGFIWCMLYYKTNTILGSWISHALVDGMIMYIGSLLIFS